MIQIQVGGERVSMVSLAWVSCPHLPIKPEDIGEGEVQGKSIGPKGSPGAPFKGREPLMDAAQIKTWNVTYNTLHLDA